MKTINITNIIDKHGLVTRDVAKHLFPNNKHYVFALSRIIKGEALLDSDQISKLASLIGIPINELFESEKWDMKASKDGLHFTHNDYTADLNTDTWVTKVYKDASLFHETVLHSGSIPLKDYLKLLSQTIKNKENESSRN